ncbi:MAG TPA: ethanolamine ammonia-lyase subunit EutC [Candidatus Obscuribacterales bacterium]
MTLNDEKKDFDPRAGESVTPARVSVGRCGTRPPTIAWIRFRQDHALARDAIRGQLSDEFLTGFISGRSIPIVQSTASSLDDFISFPPKGKRLDEESIARLVGICPQPVDVQIVICDGLSARAVERNVPDLLPMIEDGLRLGGISSGLPVLVRFGRVAVADQIAHALKAKLVINLIGERPGLSCSEGLSAYITYDPGPQTISSDRTVVSNIHPGGTPAVEAGAYIVSLAKTILEHKVSGVKLQKLS